jgi:hypothetical protein
MLQGNGTAAKKAASGTQKMEFAVGLDGPRASISAYDVQRLTRHLSGLPRNKAEVFALDTAKQPIEMLQEWTMRLGRALFARARLLSTSTRKNSHAVRLVQAKPFRVRARVYDLTVRDEHVFYANGLLVGNCADSFRYLSLASKPVMRKGGKGATISTPKAGAGAHYAFSLDKIWDCGPKDSARVG